MNFARQIHYSFMLVLLCLAAAAAAGICGFYRLVPAVNALNERNARSLYYAEQMLVSLTADKNISKFEENLENAAQNTTEQGEEAAVNNIKRVYDEAFAGNKSAFSQAVYYITDLAEINRLAMRNACDDKKRMRDIGIWMIIFPSAAAWIIGVMLLNALNRILVKPFEELKQAVSSYRKGNYMRRCPNTAASKDFQEIYDDLNSILDSIEIKPKI